MRTEILDGSAIYNKDKAVEPKKHFKGWLISHFRRISLVVLNWFFNHDCIFAMVGGLNRRFHFIESVFVAYPAIKEYTLAYGYKKQVNLYQWTPYFSGVIWQNGKIEIMFAISATEEDFINPLNRENLRKMTERTEKVKKLLYASQKRFAGILPGILLLRRFIRYSVEAEVTVKIVALAERKVEELQNYKSVPLIILGGKGFIGRKLVKKLISKGRNIYCVDMNGQFVNMEDWPSHLRGKRAIMINVTRKAVLSRYLPLFWPELILLNEVYPEPSKKELNVLKRIGSPCYHVVGVRAKALPRFPGVYAGGIPCCAAWPSEKLEVIIKQLA